MFSEGAVRQVQVQQSTGNTAQHRPAVVTHGRFRDIVRYVQRRRDVIVGSDESIGDPSVLLTVALLCSGAAGTLSLLVVPDRERARRIGEAVPPTVDDLVIHADSVAVLGLREDTRDETRVLKRGPRVVATTPGRLIDHLRQGTIELSGVSVCLLAPPAESDRPQFTADLHYIFAKFDRQPVVVLFDRTGAEDPEITDSFMRRPSVVSLGPGNGRLSHKTGDPTPNTNHDSPQEHTIMANRELPFDPEATAQLVRDIIRKIHEDEDPAEMNQYKRFLRRHVSIFSRAYFTAFLFKHFAGGSAGSSSRTSIFVSAGRNRRVHARDLVTLFTSVGGVTRDDIGQIKVLDNYSFVELEASKAKQAIDDLNGTDFRGRKLTVNYAKRK